MFSRVFALAAIALTLSAQVQAHATISPVLGLKAAVAPKRADAQRVSAAKPCGKTNIAATIDTSTPVVAAADGTFTVTATNFNAGRDGSRQVTMTVDAAGTGKNFVAGTVSKNGVAAPTSNGSDQITAALPAGTTCTGGAAGNLCLVAFKTLGGFGNCVAVQQGAGAAAAGTAAANGTATAGGAGAAAGAGGAGAAAGGAATTAATGGAATNGTAAATGAAQTGAANTAGTGKAAGVKAAIKDKIDQLKNAFGGVGGTRAPRALRAREAALLDLELSE